MIDFPNDCYCFETLGLEPIVDLNNDEIIDYTEPIDGFPYWNSTNFSETIYRCKRCEKNHTIKIAY